MAKHKKLDISYWSFCTTVALTGRLEPSNATMSSTATTLGRILDTIDVQTLMSEVALSYEKVPSIPLRRPSYDLSALHTLSLDASVGYREHVNDLETYERWQLPNLPLRLQIVPLF